MDKHREEEIRRRCQKQVKLWQEYFIKAQNKDNEEDIINNDDEDDNVTFICRN